MQLSAAVACQVSWEAEAPKCFLCCRVQLPFSSQACCIERGLRAGEMLVLRGADRRVQGWALRGCVWMFARGSCTTWAAC